METEDGPSHFVDLGDVGDVAEESGWRIFFRILTLRRQALPVVIVVPMFVQSKGFLLCIFPYSIYPLPLWPRLFDCWNVEQLWSGNQSVTCLFMILYPWRPTLIFKTCYLTEWDSNPWCFVNVIGKFRRSATPLTFNPEFDKDRNAQRCLTSKVYLVGFHEPSSTTNFSS
jgi:hypothetical protein